MNEQEIQAQLPELATKEAAIQVVDAASYTSAAAEVKVAKQFQKNIKDFFAPLKQKAHEAHKAITQKEKETLKPVEDFCKKIQQKMISWQSEQDRIRREEEAMLREEQRKLEEEARLAEAAEAEAAGDTELAQDILEEEIEVAPVMVQDNTPKVSGLFTRETWKAEVTDMGALVKYVAENPAWFHLLTVNTKELNSLAKSQKSAMAIPGVRAFAEKTMVTKL